MSEAPVRTRVQGGVAHVTLNRPDARNAVTIALAGALHDALSDAAVYADLIVIRGAGGQFCAGGDVNEVARLRRLGPAALRSLSETFLAACELIAELPVPVVAAVEGTVAAGGFELVRSVDIAIVRDDAVLAADHANLGTAPGGGGAPWLPRAVGMPRALGHLLTGDRLTGRQAADWGLVYRSVPPQEFESAVAALIASLEGRDRDSLTRIKRLVRASAPEPPGAGLRRETEATPEGLAGQQAGAGVGRSTQRGRR